MGDIALILKCPERTAVLDIFELPCDGVIRVKEIRRNYLHLALRIHPDKVPNDITQEATDAMKKVSNAFQIAK